MVERMERSPPAKRQRLSKQERAGQLLDIAEGLFLERGYEAATLDEVARLAGISRPIVYGHFGSKEGLFLACAGRSRERFEQQITAAVQARASDDMGAIVERGGDVFFQVLEQDPKRWALLFASTTATSGELADGLAALRDQTIQQIAGMVRLLAPAGITEESIQACAHAVSGIGEQLGRWWLRNPSMPRAVVSGYYRVFIVGGIEGMLRQLAVAGPKVVA